MKFFNRTYSLNLSGTVVTGLRVIFEITHTDASEANSSNIQIYNLNPTTRGLLSESDHPRIQLDVGYDGENTTIFRGNTRTARSNRDAESWITDIDAGDGEIEIRRGLANVSFPAGTEIATMVDRLVQYTGIDIGNLVETINDTNLRNVITEYERGATFFGNAHHMLVKLGKALGFRISVQDGTYQATPLAGTLPGNGYVISQTSGMVGSPDVGDGGVVSVKSRLLPMIRPQHKVELRTATVNGFYRVKSAKHSGDSRGANWHTTLDLRAL